jgi:hypothetical protein
MKMRYQKNLEHSIEKSYLGNIEVSADAEMDERILGDALAAMEESKKTNPAVAGPNIGRVIMKSSITKLAAAAMIIIGVLVAIQQVGDSSLAWADVREAFLKQPWVHLKYDNGAERWYDLQTGHHYYRDWDGRCVFVDRELNIRQVYYALRGEHISEDRPVIYKDGVIPPWQPETAWESVVGHWEEIAENERSSDWEVERNMERIDGKRQVRFDCFYNDAIGRRLLIKKIWADPRTRLPVKVRERLSLADRQEQKREFITGEFDFPDSGPSSIYDLGVSRDLPIIKHYDKVALPSIIEVVEAGKANLENFPQQYRALRWDNTRESEVEVVFRNREKIHHNHYFSMEDYPEYYLELPASAEDVVQWAQTQVPVNVAVFDGSRSYTRSNPHPSPSFTTRPEPRVRVSRDSGLFSSSRPHEALWPYANRNPARFEWIEDAPQELSGYIGLRINVGDIRRDLYIDPDHDYICIRWIWWKQRSGRWEKEREYESSDFIQLPEGQWYAGKRVLITYPDPERGTVRGGANWNIDFKVLEENEYPPDAFNGEKLLEGAKIETY